MLIYQLQSMKELAGFLLKKLDEQRNHSCNDSIKEEEQQLSFQDLYVYIGREGAHVPGGRCACVSIHTETGGQHQVPSISLYLNCLRQGLKLTMELDPTRMVKL